MNYESQEQYNQAMSEQAEAMASQDAQAQAEFDAEHDRNLDELLGALKSTRNQSTYLSLKEIAEAIKKAFPGEYHLIAHFLQERPN